MYSSKRVIIPKPELYVIYTGDRKTQPEGRTKTAVRETIRICKDSNVLKEYLESKKVRLWTL